MVRVEKTTDEDYIKSVFLNDTVYSQMRDDSCPEEPTLLHARDIRSIPGFFLRVLNDELPAGVFWLVWKDSDLEAHTALLGNCRGRDAIEAARQAIQWVFENTLAGRITSYAWSDAPRVQWFCRSVGLQETCRSPWPSTRSGKPVLVINYEIARQHFKV